MITTRQIAGRTVLLTALVAATISLSGCSAITDLLGGENVTRDSVTEEVTEGGDADVFNLHVGDCFDDDSAGGAVSDVPAVPCDQPHDNEIYYLFDLTETDYPGDDTVTAEADAGCLAQFEAFVGVSYDASTLDYFTLTPTEDSWTSINDREIVCSVYDPSAQTSGTLAGVAR